LSGRSVAISNPSLVLCQFRQPFAGRRRDAPDLTCMALRLSTAGDLRAARSPYWRHCNERHGEDDNCVE
jgi:hypothetical protein